MKKQYVIIDGSPVELSWWYEVVGDNRHQYATLYKKLNTPKKEAK
jgi:hypothetical protein